MKTFEIPKKSKKNILALGAESAGNFSAFHQGKIYFSEDFGDLLEDKNYNKFKKSVLGFLKKNKIKPDIILTDLHPEYKTTLWGEELCKKFKAKHIRVQHHFAHILSAIGENILHSKICIRKSAIGIALDGTGYGLDGKIWGGEVFRLQIADCRLQIERIGHLENQTLVGGDLTVKEPARMLISILSKFQKKDEVYKYTKKYYSENQFELLYNQLKQNFNCVETSSTGRVLDAVSVLLGFAKNERNYKHEPITLLEQNSTIPYNDLKLKIKKCYMLHDMCYVMYTTPLFEYLIKNLHRDKKRLAATAQLYIAQGLYKIIQNSIPSTRDKIQNSYFSGGVTNNKIISSYLESKGVITNKKIPRGDAGISFGQIIHYLLSIKSS